MRTGPRLRIDGMGSTSSERVGFLREGGSAGAEKVIWAFLSQVIARGRVGLGWAVLVYEGGMLWELEKMYVVGLP